MFDVGGCNAKVEVTAVIEFEVQFEIVCLVQVFHVLVGILHCFFVRYARDIEQAIDPGLISSVCAIIEPTDTLPHMHGISPLIAQLDRGFGQSHFIVNDGANEMLYGCDNPYIAGLPAISNLTNASDATNRSDHAQHRRLHARQRLEQGYYMLHKLLQCNHAIDVLLYVRDITVFRDDDEL